MTLSRFVSIGFGLGLLRPAPGTWGSAGALAVGMLITYATGFWELAIATLLATLAGFWSCRTELRDRPGADPSEIVIDEVAGQWIALLFPAFAFWWIGFEGWMPYPAWIGAFVFFRLFDIWKPWLVGRADRRGDADGVMLDDLWAGLFAGLAVWILAAVAHLGVLL